jgi:hypothetical protein
MARIFSFIFTTPQAVVLWGLSAVIGFVIAANASSIVPAATESWMSPNTWGLDESRALTVGGVQNLAALSSAGSLLVAVVGGLIATRSQQKPTSVSVKQELDRFLKAEAAMKRIRVPQKAPRGVSA